MSTRDTIISVFERVAADQGRTLAPMVDELKLAECGLDSLSFAIVIAHLEEALGIVPFDSDEWVDFPATLAEFVALYDHACAK